MTLFQSGKIPGEIFKLLKSRVTRFDVYNPVFLKRNRICSSKSKKYPESKSKISLKRQIKGNLKEELRHDANCIEN